MHFIPRKLLSLQDCYHSRKLLYPPGEGMECYLEVSLCWHSRFRKTWRTQVASLLVTVGTDDSKGRIQLRGRCSIPSFLCTTVFKPCLEETFIFHTRAGDPFVTKLGSCCHGNTGFHTPAFHNVDFSESGCWRIVCLLEICGYGHQETTAAR